MAVHALVKNGSAEAINALADTLVTTTEHQYFRLAEKNLIELAKAGKPEARDAFCRLLIQHEHPLAYKVIFEMQFAPSDPALSAAFSRALTSLLLRSEGPGLDYSPQHAFKLLQKMAAEGSIDAQDALCNLVIKHDHPQASECVLSAGYAPSNPYQRAVFYILTAQWEQYERFDFKRNLLQTAYKMADQVLQERLATSARQGGRADILASLVTGTFSATRMTAKDWAAIVGFWQHNEHWEDLWQLLQSCPVYWGMHIMSLLQEARWNPSQEAERELFTRLSTYTQTPPSETAIGWLAPCLAVLPEYANIIKRFCFSIGGPILACGYNEETIRLWAIPDELTQAHLRHLSTMKNTCPTHYSYQHRSSLRTFQDHRSKICCLEIDSKNLRLASGDQDGKIYWWSAGDSLKTHVLDAHPLRINCLSFSADGHFLLSSGAEGTIRFWELRSKLCLRKIQQQGHYSLCLTLSPSNKQIISGDSDTNVRIWNRSEGTILQELQGHSAPVTCLALSPDGRFLLSGSQDCSIKLWELSSGKLLTSFSGHDAGITQLVISPDGEFLVSASRDRTLRLWQMPEGRVLKVFPKHSSDISCIALSPDGQILLRADTNKMACVWALNRVYTGDLRAQQIRPYRLSLIQERLQEQETPEDERRHLNFLHELLRWQKRFDIEIGENDHKAAHTQFDIEIA